MQGNNQHLLEGISSKTQNFYYQFLDMCKHMESRQKLYMYLTSVYGAWSHRKYFKNLEKYCMFIGCGRTGHSLVAACLDAHPDMIISDELNTARFIKNGFSKEQTCYLILKHSQDHAQDGRKVAGYSYAVPNQWQGRFREIKIIGDKDAAATTAMLQNNPALLDAFHKRVGDKISYIHVIRNPYDVIATFTQREKVDIETAIELYFLVCKAATELKARIDKEKVFEIGNESFIANPVACLKEICDFLEIEAPHGYLEDCASIVYKEPHKSRFKVKWTPQLIDLVREKIINRYQFLSHYSYED